MIDTLVLSGGGLKGFGFIGSLKVLEENNIIKIKNIKHYYANSVGSILSLLLAIGYSINSIEKFITKFDFTKIISNIDLLKLFNNLGIFDGEKIMIVIKTMLFKKIKVNDINFIDFYQKYKIKLNFMTTNYTLGQEEILSLETTPELSILTAIRMSISIPFIFTPIKYNDNIYIDGFLTNNFPIDKIDINKNNYIALKLNNEYKRNNPNLIEFMYGCFHILAYNIKLNNNLLKNNKIIEINTEFVQENFNYENIIIIINLGKTIANNYINNNNFINNIKLFNHIEKITSQNINIAIQNLSKNNLLIKKSI